MKIAGRRGLGAASQRPSSTFTGEVWMDPVMAGEDGIRIGNVFFTPGARTYWHSHEHGQVLQVTVGRGLVGTEGHRPAVIAAGDFVWAPPGEKHWHGAGADSCVQHVATSLGTTSWLGPVTDVEYTLEPSAPDQHDQAP